MVLSIKVVFFGKEGISADLITVNEDVGAACWGYLLGLQINISWK